MKQTLLAISLALAASSVSLAQAGVLKIGATPVPFAEILEHIQRAHKVMKQTLLAISLALAASSVSLAQAGVLKIGATPVPFAEILEHIQPALEKRGVKLEITEFNDYVQPNFAVAEGELDVNLFQHKPYLDMFIKDHGSDLVDVGAVLIAPMGVYSHKIQNLSEVKEGASVGIPNDPTNGGRALLLLAKAGLIKVSDPNDANITVLDIAVLLLYLLLKS